MLGSPARFRANHANAAHSSGPRTAYVAPSSTENGEQTHSLFGDESRLAQVNLTKDGEHRLHAAMRESHRLQAARRDKNEPTTQRARIQ